MRSFLCARPTALSTELPAVLRLASPTGFEPSGRFGQTTTKRDEPAPHDRGRLNSLTRWCYSLFRPATITASISVMATFALSGSLDTASSGPRSELVSVMRSFLLANRSATR